MSITLTLLTILSGVCLLLWGLRTVKRAVLRGYGAQVKSAIGRGTSNRFSVFGSGFVATLFLQSSTATALLASSFVGRGLMTVSAGLAVMIGADVGTAIIAQILSFDMRWLAPLLLSTGIIPANRDSLAANKLNNILSRSIIIWVHQCLVRVCKKAFAFYIVP